MLTSLFMLKGTQDTHDTTPDDECEQQPEDQVLGKSEALLVWMLKCRHDSNGFSSSLAEMIGTRFAQTS